MIERRTLIGGIALAGAMVGAPLLFAKPGKRPLAEPGWRLSDAAWKKRLTPFQYKVLREAATERPFTSPLNDEHRAGIFACAGCALPLYSSRTKFESGTGWPSRSEEHTSELQSLMRISYAVFCLKKKTQ